MVDFITKRRLQKEEKVLELARLSPSNEFLQLSTKSIVDYELFLLEMETLNMEFHHIRKESSSK